MLIAGYTLPQIRKAIVSFAGLVALTGSALLDEYTDVWPAGLTKWIAVAVGAAVAIGVFLTRNAKVIDSAGDAGSVVGLPGPGTAE